MFLPIGDIFSKIFDTDDNHQYFGKLFPGNLRRRGQDDIAYWRGVCRGKFLQHSACPHFVEQTLVPTIAAHFFEAFITPTVLFGLATTPMITREMLKLDAFQRRTLRKVVGWGRLAGENWQTTTRRMNTRMQIANQFYPLKLWGDILTLSKLRSAARCEFRPEHSWPQVVVHWNPQQQAMANAF